MKRIFISLFIVVSLGLLAGCCTNDICGSGATYVATTSGSSSNNTCQTCNNTCNTCGSNASYTYGGWY